MSILLHHHPFSRARHVVWMLEEAGLNYDLRYVDMQAGAHKAPEYQRRNRMGKLPILEDGGAVISETAAIAMYLADRYAPGRLAPALDAPERGPYLRWCVYGASVLEPAAAANAAGWDYRPGAVGWGTYEDVVATLEAGLKPGPWLLGEQFSMADVLLGGTVRWLLGFGMLKGTDDTLQAYADRLSARPAAKRSEEVNAAVIAEKGLPTR